MISIDTLYDYVVLGVTGLLVYFIGQWVQENRNDNFNDYQNRRKQQNYNPYTGAKINNETTTKTSKPAPKSRTDYDDLRKKSFRKQHSHL